MDATPSVLDRQWSLLQPLRLESGASPDTGPGVAEELRERIFEPFFTTKPIGSGTGLGLAIAYNVVRAHDGHIAVGTSPEGGARFTISVPLRATT